MGKYQLDEKQKKLNQNYTAKQFNQKQDPKEKIKFLKQKIKKASVQN